MRKAFAAVLLIMAILVIGGVVFHIVVEEDASPPVGARPIRDDIAPAAGVVVLEETADSARGSQLALVADDEGTIKKALANLITALETNDLPLALGIASTLRSNTSAAGIIHDELLNAEAINPEAVSSRYRITALCLAAQDSEIDRLCAAMKRGWEQDALTDANKESWQLVNERRPLTQRASSALNEPDRSSINGLIKALLYRLSDKTDDTADACWNKLWQTLREPGYITDPLISVALWYPVQTYSGRKLPEYWRPFFVSIRDDVRFSLRLRIQAAAAIAPVSDNVMDLLAHLSLSLGTQDAAEVLARFLGECPELSVDDWSLILSALLSGRNLGDGSSILFDGIMSARKALCDGDRIGEYGDALVGLFVAANADASLSLLAGDTIYSLIVWRYDPQVPHRRIAVFKTVDDLAILARLFRMLETDIFVRASLEPRFINERTMWATRIVRIAFELRVSLDQKLNLVRTALNRCASEREREVIAGEALGSIGGLSKDDASQGSGSLLSTAFELCNTVMDNWDPEKHWAVAAACLNGLRVLRTLAEFSAFPELSAAELGILQRQHDAFHRNLATLREVVGDNKRQLAKVDQQVADFGRLTAAMDAAYSLPWLEKESGENGE